ncbi:hypothetical protein NtRootA4_32810 [Arthrobacter sp. NtRootA4]|nr:hypothetical protein NtRootA2_35020 [Arthrobacter sp. NtRootA2]BCW16302.1 hypothetical protein NtRootA4_32810 [Arthrobacter sp. NtRootA4]BCW24634.1 hypothetical protein NtRootC7_35010 [Arthrobacter sp. NtRootC7]BCW28905.1 hypothetical protein NtRootC45_35050 [Arthrobacter sp. NtRootC45]BCW33175.1 hypothetical protein NtRootD5_35060 [Arthrobacter sp. NtRootD5]
MEKCTVFVMADPDALPVRYYKAWEYFLPGDEVDVRNAGGVPTPGVVVAVMPDGSGIWVYINGVGQRLFGVDEDVDITVTGTPAGAGREKA